MTSSLADSPLYLHIASSGSFIQLRSYEFHLESASAAKEIQPAVAAANQLSQTAREEKEVEEVAEMIINHSHENDETMMDMEVQVDDDSPIPISEAYSQMASNQVTTSVVQEQEQGDTMMIDVQSAPDSSFVPANSSSIECVPTSTSSALMSHRSSIAAPISSEWSAFDLMCLLVLIVLTSIGSAHLLAIMCQHIMS